jgi:hypothetical protein
MVNGHIFHIGVRLIATIYRGDDDETRPSELLDQQRPWFAFAAMQLAVALIVEGLVARSADVTGAGAAFGLLGWITMISALASARGAARASAVSA